MPTLTLSPRGAARLHNGHVWVYRSDVQATDAQAGDVVQVVDLKGRALGSGFFSDRSQIALRLLTRDGEPFDTARLAARIDRAIAFRESLAIDSTACRLVHGEADLLPSLIVDRYGEHLVVQTLSQGMDRLLPDVVQLLVERLSPAGVLARNDPKVRLLEGLEQTVEARYGSVPAHVPVVEAGIRYDVDLWAGQKTGLFLDQRENRAAAEGYAHGRALDAFSYHGGFALRLARHADHVLAIDVSGAATARLSENAAANALTNVEARTANVFDELRELDRADEQFDTIVLDPPAFAKNRSSLGKALSGYKEINLRALRLLRRGGILVTCTCSYHVDEATFGEVVFGAALDAGVTATLVEKRMQSRDHPVRLGVPETYYLKCFVLRRID